MIPSQKREAVKAICNRFHCLPFLFTLSNRRVNPFRSHFQSALSQRHPDPVSYTHLEKNEYSKPAVSIGKFANEPFLFLQQENDIYVRGMQICKNAGFTPNVRLYLNQMVSSYYLACDGYGIAFIRSIIPKYVAYSDQILFYRLTDSDVYKRQADLEVDDLLARPLHGQCLFIDLADSRRLHAIHSFRNSNTHRYTPFIIRKARRLVPSSL